MITYFLTLLLKTASVCFYLCTVGVFKRRNRALIIELWGVIGLRLFVKKYVSPVDITSLVPSQVSVQLCE